MKWRYFLLTIVIAGTWAGSGFAQDPSQVSLVLVPVQTSFVKGDLAKFRAMNWTKDGAQSGIRSATLDAKVGKDVNVSFEGSGMVGDEDYSGSMLLSKENVGYVKLSYDTLRKYYENKGGYYPGFTTPGLQLKTLKQDLEMDIGHFAMEVGKGSPQDPDFSLGYERGTKKGLKNSTTWGYIKDYAVSANTTVNRRKIAPVFLDKDETTDTLTARGKIDVSGFTVKGEQKYVFFDAKTTRQEQVYASAAGTAAEKMIRKQTEMPQTKDLTSTLRAERWSLNDKTYLAFGYRYAHLRNDMLTEFRDYNSTTGLRLASGGTFRNGDAENTQDSHIFTGHFLSNLTDSLTFISRFKAELQTIDSSSVRDSLNSSLVVTSSPNQSAENKITSTAESFSLRYNGISKTALYADMELKQERYWRSSELSTGESIESVNGVPEGTGTIGMRISPVKNVSITTEVKHHEKNDKLVKVDSTEDDYINNLNTTSDSISSRLTWKTFKWLENSFKIKQSSNVYHIQVDSLDESKMPNTERDFVYDLTYLPTDELMFNFSPSLKMLKTGGVGSQNVATPPPYTANVYTLALSSSYAPTEKFSLFNTIEYSRAINQTNAAGHNTTYALALTGPMLMGVDASWYNIDTGARWSVKKDLSIEPHYGYSSYRTKEGVETGNFSAHLVWLDVDLKW